MGVQHRQFHALLAQKALAEVPSSALRVLLYHQAYQSKETSRLYRTRLLRLVPAELGRDLLWLLQRS